MSDFNEAQEWTRFIHQDNNHVATIQIRHWNTDEPYFNVGIHRWNIYLLVFNTCKKYNDFINGKRLPIIPFHGGVTYFTTTTQTRWGGDIYSNVKIGCDYNHLGDEHYSHYDVDNISFFKGEAERIYNWFIDYMSGENSDEM